MTLTLCEKKGCRSRNKKAVWLFNRMKLCSYCFDVEMEKPSAADASIHRLSDNERDFPERMTSVLTRHMPI